MSFDVGGEGKERRGRREGTRQFVPFVRRALERPAKCKVAVADCCFEFDASINICIMRQERLTQRNFSRPGIYSVISR